MLAVAEERTIVVVDSSLVMTTIAPPVSPPGGGSEVGRPKNLVESLGKTLLIDRCPKYNEARPLYFFRVQGLQAESS
ncbi:unnamed protein product [Prunus armeniaca]|uniref:Uncharacterized protein n=1 Tax=Prunus armeniaca TaxID=36596 RepID=A0A6J5VJ62_PRUAR|nr:unnamed protein product [Prunus armeniaca]